MKKLLLILVAIVLLGCQSKESGELETIKIGVTPVPHAQIVELIKDDLLKQGVKVEIVEFNDYLTPNIALNDGSIDANFFQHEPFFNENIASNKLDLVSLGVVHIEPMALYSQKYASIEQLPKKAKILIPNDPTNGSRALLLLHKNGLIEMKNTSDFTQTEQDIIKNEHEFEFIAMDAAAITSALVDADAAIINSNFAIKADLSPSKGLLIEDKESPYANLVAVRKGEENQEKFKKLMEALHSDKVKQFLEDTFKGEIFPAF